MNPLDKEELRIFENLMEEDMPKHTNIMTKIKGSYSKRFPKNLMDY